MNRAAWLRAEGLLDRRLGKPSPKQVPAADARLLGQIPYAGRRRARST
jgi:hypothetical protein